MKSIQTTTTDGLWWQ